MILPALLEFLLSTARAAGGMGVVLASFAVGKWSYANPQATWADLWRNMPAGMRRLVTALLAMTLISHILLTVGEFSDSPRPVHHARERALPETEETDAPEIGSETLASGD